MMTESLRAQKRGQNRSIAIRLTLMTGACLVLTTFALPRSVFVSAATPEHELQLKDSEVSSRRAAHLEASSRRSLPGTPVSGWPGQPLSASQASGRRSGPASPASVSTGQQVNATQASSRTFRPDTPVSTGEPMEDSRVSSRTFRPGTPVSTGEPMVDSKAGSTTFRPDAPVSTSEQLEDSKASSGTFRPDTPVSTGKPLNDPEVSSRRPFVLSSGRTERAPDRSPDARQSTSETNSAGLQHQLANDSSEQCPFAEVGSQDATRKLPHQPPAPTLAGSRPSGLANHATADQNTETPPLPERPSGQPTLAPSLAAPDRRLEVIIDDPRLMVQAPATETPSNRLPPSDTNPAQSPRMPISRWPSLAEQRPAAIPRLALADSEPLPLGTPHIRPEFTQLPAGNALPSASREVALAGDQSRPSENGSTALGSRESAYRSAEASHGTNADGSRSDSTASRTPVVIRQASAGERPAAGQLVSQPSLLPEVMEGVPTVEVIKSPEFSNFESWVPGSSCPRYGVHCGGCLLCEQPTWKDQTLIPWEVFAQGEYVGPHRAPHVPEYRLRVDDKVHFIYRLTAEASTKPYEFNVGDRVRIESLTQAEVNQELVIQPDGNTTLKLVGQVRAAGRTVESLRADLEEKYKKFIKEPGITITPLEMNNRLLELRNAVDSRSGPGGQTVESRVTPEGTVQLPGIGSVPVQGLTLDEAREEINQRYLKLLDGGLDITPVLFERAPRFVYVLGEVRQPGRLELTGPTTVMQALAMAGSWNVGAKLRHVVILRRDDNWELMATKLNLVPALRGADPCPADEVWLRDSDVVLVPKSELRIANDLIEQVFTRGIYSVFPIRFNYLLRQDSMILPVGP